jgi:hypothetical protein
MNYQDLEPRHFRWHDFRRAHAAFVAKQKPVFEGN